MSIDTRSADAAALVEVTPSAVRELRRLLGDENSESAVRLGVKGGGCSGFSYVIEFDVEREGDHVIETDGVRFLLDRKSTIYLKGTVLDFQDGLHGKGFVFNNPNATSTCGCGESFSV